MLSIGDLAMKAVATQLIDRARAFWIARPGVGEVREEALFAPLPDEVLVRARYSGISRGTESLVFQGRVPESEYERMRCPHQVGTFAGPLKYGYSSVGVVASSGRDYRPGQWVFCLYPHQTAYVASERALLPIPNALPPARAILAANMETALNALWDAAPQVGDRVSVVGAGVVGCLCAFLLGRFPGVEVELVDLLAERAGIARNLGVGFALPSAAQQQRDLVLHASGSEAGLRQSLELGAKDCTVLELSWFGDSEVRLPLGGSFHQQRLSLRGSQVGTVSPAARRRFDHRARLALALELCADPALDCLIDGETELEALPELMPRLSAHSGPLCQRVNYPNEDGSHV